MTSMKDAVTGVNYGASVVGIQSGIKLYLDDWSCVARLDEE